MKKAAIAAVLLVAAATGTALAEEGRPYLGASAGFSIPHDSTLSVAGSNQTANLSYDPGYALGVSLGYDVNPVRVELEYAYRSAKMKELSAGGAFADASDTDLSVSSYMVNGLYDFKTRGSALTPFVGAGVGLLNGKVTQAGVSVDDTEFGYQLMCGVGIKMSRSVDLDLTYKFQGAASDFSKDGVGLSYHSSNVLAGVRLKF